MSDSNPVPHGTSTVAGPLQPVGTQPAADINLDLLLQPIITGLTGMTPALVRPSWQPAPPPQPPATTDWCSLGATTQIPQGNSYQKFVPGSDGMPDQMQMYRNERVEVTLTYYGPNAMLNAGILRDAFQIGQNRDVIKAIGLNFTDAQAPQRVPELENGQFVERADITLIFARVIMRSYNIDQLVAIPAILTSSDGVSTTTTATIGS